MDIDSCVLPLKGENLQLHICMNTAEFVSDTYVVSSVADQSVDKDQVQMVYFLSLIFILSTFFFLSILLKDSNRDQVVRTKKSDSSQLSLLLVIIAFS